MGVQDNPAVFGNWAITGIGGACVILERLCDEGVELSGPQLDELSAYLERAVKVYNDQQAKVSALPSRPEGLSLQGQGVTSESGEQGSATDG